MKDVEVDDEEDLEGDEEEDDDEHHHHHHHRQASPVVVRGVRDHSIKDSMSTVTMLERSKKFMMPSTIGMM